MILRSKTILLLSIVLLIGAIVGVSLAAIAFADDPFKNKGGIDDDRFPVGYVDKLKVIFANIG
jgi:hypothetical protein